MDTQSYSREDIELSIRVFHKAIEVFNIPPEPTNEQAKQFIKTDGTVDLDKVPMRTIKTWDNGVKFLNLTYFYDGFLTVYADYNPVVAILGFIDSARELLKTKFPSASGEDIEKWTEMETYKMTFSLLSRIYQRMDLAMRNYTDEVITNWQIEFYRWMKRINTESGIKTPPFPEKKYFRTLIRNYEDEVVDLWFNAPDRNLDEKKMQLAREYPSILKHWQKLRKEYVEYNSDWREYAKAGKFFDTPDDLIDLLEDSSNISYLALEHAGRRAELLNLDAKPEHLEKRQHGIKVTGYTPRQLSNLKKNGEKLLNEMQM
jgi:hypothetical protein